MKRTATSPHQVAYSEIVREGWWSQYRLPLLFLAPALLVIFIFFAIPVVVTLLIGLTDMSVSTGLKGYHYIGWDNFEKIFKSPWTTVILKNTLIYVFGTLVFFNVGLALVISVACSFMSRKVAGIFRALWLLPRITPSVVYVLMVKWATADPPFGIINQILTPLGLEPRNWMYFQPMVFVIVINGMIGASMGMILFGSAIQAIPRNHFLAAEVDGSSNWLTIRRIILPQLKWPVLFVTAYQTLSLITSFEYIMLTTNGGPGFYSTETWSLYAYHIALSNYYGNSQFGLGSALASILMLLGIIASIIYLKVFKFRSMVAPPKIEIN